MTQPDTTAHDGWNSRSIGLIGEEGVNLLAGARVLIAGVGGVGGYAAEMLARSGVGHLTLVDADCVSVSNINRQLIALGSTVGLPKTELFAARFRDINPDVDVEPLQQYITPDNVQALLEPGYNFVVDCIDTVAPKTALIAEAFRTHTPIISSMGAGGRLDPTKVGYFDVWETREDGLARAVRQRLKKTGLRKPLKVVASTEAPRPSAIIELNEPNKRSSYGTLATIPSLFGIYLGSYVVNKLIGL